MSTGDKAVQWLMDRADKIGGFIDELAKQLGVAATHVYEVLVKQQFVDGITLLVKAGIWIGVLILVWVLVNKLIFKNWSKFDSGDYRDSDYHFMFGIVIFLVGIATIWVGFYVIDWVTLGIQKLMNPEYFALQDIMDFVKGQVDKK